jgi:hypothetical protein
MRLRPTSLELLILLSVVGVSTALGIEEVGTRRGLRDGVNDAEADIASGRLRWMCGGKPRHWRSTENRLLKERYGVESRSLYGCCPTSYQSSYARAYNDRMQRHLVEAHPEFSIADLDADARREWERAKGIAE